MRVLVFLLSHFFPALSRGRVCTAALAGYPAVSLGTADGRYCKQSLETVRVVSQPEGFLLAFSELRHA
jgi:hypothetical protein